MSFDPTGGAISGADDVALSNPQTDHVLTYDASLEKWQNEAILSGGASVISDLSDVTVSSLSAGQVLKYDGSDWINDTDEANAGADVVVAVSAVTVTQANVQIVGRNAPDEQTIELRHVNAAGTTETLLSTVIVAANSTASSTPPSFSRAFVVGDRLRAVRIAGTGDAPLVAVQA